MYRAKWWAGKSSAYKRQRLDASNKWRRKRYAADAAYRRRILKANFIVRLRNKYGITWEFYQTRVRAQQNRCAICGKRPKGRRLHLDHEHASGAFRGLLCLSCNRMLGLAKDSPEVLRNGAKYLKRAWRRIHGVSK